MPLLKWIGSVSVMGHTFSEPIVSLAAFLCANRLASHYLDEMNHLGHLVQRLNSDHIEKQRYCAVPIQALLSDARLTDKARTELSRLLNLATAKVTVIERDVVRLGLLALPITDNRIKLDLLARLVMYQEETGFAAPTYDERYSHSDIESAVTEAVLRKNIPEIDRLLGLGIKFKTNQRAIRAALEVCRCQDYLNGVPGLSAALAPEKSAFIRELSKRKIITWKTPDLWDLHPLCVAIKNDDPMSLRDVVTDPDFPSLPAEAFRNVLLLEEKSIELTKILVEHGLLDLDRPENFKLNPIVRAIRAGDPVALVESWLSPEFPRPSADLFLSVLFEDSKYHRSAGLEGVKRLCRLRAAIDQHRMVDLHSVSQRMFDWANDARSADLLLISIYYGADINKAFWSACELGWGHTYEFIWKVGVARNHSFNLSGLLEVAERNRDEDLHRFLRRAGARRSRSTYALNNFGEFHNPEAALEERLAKLHLGNDDETIQ